MNVKIKWKTVGTIAKFALELAFGYAVLKALPSVVEICIDGHDDIPASAGYGEAVDAIMNSGMSSYYKDEVLNKLARNESDGYYKAVISILKSEDLSSYYKDEMIEKISKK